MRIKKFNEAEQYVAPNHQECHSLRLAGFEKTGPESFWVGHTNFLPGGGAGPDASPLEKVYHILEGELTIEVDGKSEIAVKGDTVFIAGGEMREIRNKTNEIVKMIVVMPYPPKEG